MDMREPPVVMAEDPDHNRSKRPRPVKTTTLRTRRQPLDSRIYADMGGFRDVSERGYGAMFGVSLVSSMVGVVSS
jgi:hypothetical protein